MKQFIKGCQGHFYEVLVKESVPKDIESLVNSAFGIRNDLLFVKEMGFKIGYELGPYSFWLKDIGIRICLSNNPTFYCSIFYPMAFAEHIFLNSKYFIEPHERFFMIFKSGYCGSHHGNEISFEKLLCSLLPEQKRFVFKNLNLLG